MIAFLYYCVIKENKEYGCVYVVWCRLLVAFSFGFSPMFKDLPGLTKMSSDSIITSICIFVLYGVFIGYSISFDYQEYLREEEGQ